MPQWDVVFLQNLGEEDHLVYPLNRVSVEADIVNSQLIWEKFASQHDHPTARLPDDIAFNTVLVPANGRGT